MTRWSESLLKSRVDLEAIPVPPDCSAEERSRINDLRSLADGRYEARERLAAVRERLRKSLARGPRTAAVTAAAQALTAELDQIERDLDFAASRRGRFILFVNDWAQSVHARRQQDRDLDGVALGAHPERECIVASGTVPTPTALVRLVQLLAGHPPGVPIEYRVTVPAS